MIDHVSVGVSDLAKSAAFYEKLLAPLGYARLVERAHTVGFGKKYPEFWINLRPGMMPAQESGVHICLRARSEAAVSAFHAAALAAGGRDDGAPGMRPASTRPYFAAFIRDPDGNKIEAATFAQADA